ncbi:MAG TPA: glycosyl hydrolase family protein [Candidatus Methylacidiphilales bacterium]
MPKFTFGTIFGILAVTCALSPVSGAVPVSLKVDLATPGPKIADDFAGLSYETKRELPDAEGAYYFSAKNAPLIKMFQTLGIKNLRIGGNTVDSRKVAIPVQGDIDNLFQFAKAAQTKVIYSFRLNKGDPQNSATQAKYIANNYAANLVCYSIGNEPDIYVHSYAGYLKEWRPIYDAINQAVPNAIYCGPSLTSNAQPWAHDFARDYFSTGKILYIVQHEYAGGAGGAVKDPALGRDEMLSPEWQAIYQKYYDKFVPPLRDANVPYRLEEANNFYNGGARDVSDTFASALWGLDYLYWWAAHGSQGVNFHNGDEVAAGQQITPCRYASFTTAKDGYFAHPLAYAIKMFNLGARGQIVTSTLAPDASAKDINMGGYVVLGADKNLYVTLINREHGAGARDASVTIQTGSAPYTQGQTLALAAPNGDVAAKEGVTLGGNSIKDDGTWSEQWTDLTAKPANGQVQVEVPACSVLLVRLSGS